MSLCAHTLDEDDINALPPAHLLARMSVLGALFAKAAPCVQHSYGSHMQTVLQMPHIVRLLPPSAEIRWQLPCPRTAACPAHGRNRPLQCLGHPCGQGHARVSGARLA